MKEELKQVYTNLLNVEVKGKSAIYMANCLLMIEKLIAESTEQNDNE